MSFDSSDSDAECNSYSERTLAIIKPEAYEDAEAIENHIRNHGFSILARREVRLTPEQAAELYRGHYGRHHFPHLVAQMSSGPIIAMVLAARGCIQKWRTLMGPARVAEAQAYWPDSLRACYGRRTKYGDYFNALHGSKDHAESLREIHFFFPNMIVGPLLRQLQITDYIHQHFAVTLVPALTAVARERPAEPIIWLANYLIENHPSEPELVPLSVERLLSNWQVKDYVQLHLEDALTQALAALVAERPSEPIVWLANYLASNNPNQPRVIVQVGTDQECYSPRPEENT